jgi:hypothetical protein
MSGASAPPRLFRHARENAAARFQMPRAEFRSARTRPASGQTSIEAKATLLSGHTRRSRTAAATPHADGQPSGAIRNRVSRSRPSLRRSGGRHDVENVVACGNDARRLTVERFNHRESASPTSLAEVGGPAGRLLSVFVVLCRAFDRRDPLLAALHPDLGFRREVERCLIKASEPDLDQRVAGVDRV